VRSTIDAMTLDEKIGQLFVNLNVAFTPEYLDRVLDRYHVGGMRFRGADAATVQAHIRYAQSKSKLPLLIASNPEMGGFGSVDDGTLVCTHLQAGSHPDASIALDMGRVSGIETRHSAATGRSHPSLTSTRTGATRSSPPARSATRPRSSSSARRRTSTASANRRPPAPSSISPVMASTSATSTWSRPGTRSVSTRGTPATAGSTAR
jgi:hypothetical protein